MYKVTRELIKSRQLFSKYQLTFRNDVVRIGGGEANNCFDNSYAVAQSSKGTDNEVKCMSGWIVQPFNKSQNSTAIIQHWWTVDSTGRHFDTTPQLAVGGEYVLDFDLYEFSRENYERIKSNVAMSLLYENGKFKVQVDRTDMLFVDIDELRTELLFKYE